MHITKFGDLTMPREIMDAAGLTAGTEVRWEVGPDGLARVVPLPPPTPEEDAKRLAEFRAWLDSIEGTADGGFTTDEIMAMTRGDD